MNKELEFRAAGIIVLIVSVMFFSALGSVYTNTHSFKTTPVKTTISYLLTEFPVNQYVSVEGTVSEILPDYTSKKGYKYQQFFITDGKNSLKIFCSKYSGSVNVSVNDYVYVTGKFQKFGNTYEIYTQCKDIEKRGSAI